MKILTEFQRNPKEYKNKLDDYYFKRKLEYFGNLF